MLTNVSSGTNLHEIAPASTASTRRSRSPAAAFNFNQYLVVDDEPLLFHTGPRRLFPLVAEAIGKVLPLRSLRHVAFSHFEADECGALNEFLAAAPAAQPVCGQVAAMVSVNDVADRPARALADGEILPTGRQQLRWLDAPHVPHGWECGFLMETATRHAASAATCSRRAAPAPSRMTESDILGAERGLPRRYGLLRACPADRARSSSAWRASSRGSWRACTGAPGVGTARRSCGRSPASYGRRR